MAVSKRLRYEVLRRDQHRCKYCGRSAPEVRLTVDHVIPEALGGPDTPDNLVAACSDCNSGKSATSPDEATVADVRADALRWAAAVHAAAHDMVADIARRQANQREFEQAWNLWTVGGSRVQLPSDWRSTVDSFTAAGLPMPVLLECIDLAMDRTRINDKFRYMCGIAWRKVTELTDAARAHVGAADTKDPVPEPPTLTMADALLEEVVSALGGGREAYRLASDALWQSVAGGAQAYAAAVEDGGDPNEEALDAALEEASSTRAWFIHNLGLIARKSEGQ